MTKKSVILLKEQGLSNREVSRQLKMDRKTVARYWDEYKHHISKLSIEGVDTREIQDELYKTPKYTPEVASLASTTRRLKVA